MNKVNRRQSTVGIETDRSSEEDRRPRKERTRRSSTIEGTDSQGGWDQRCPVDKRSEKERREDTRGKKRREEGGRPERHEMGCDAHLQAASSRVQSPSRPVPSRVSPDPVAEARQERRGEKRLTGL